MCNCRKRVRNSRLTLPRRIILGQWWRALEKKGLVTPMITIGLWNGSGINNKISIKIGQQFTRSNYVKEERVDHDLWQNQRAKPT